MKHRGRNIKRLLTLIEHMYVGACVITKFFPPGHLAECCSSHFPLSTFWLGWKHSLLNTGHSQLLSSSSPDIISRTESWHVLYWNIFQKEEFHRKSIHREISILEHCGDMKDQSMLSHVREWVWERTGVRMPCGSQWRLSSTGGHLSTAMFITRKAIRKGPRCFLYTLIT